LFMKVTVLNIEKHKSLKTDFAGMNPGVPIDLSEADVPAEFGLDIRQGYSGCVKLAHDPLVAVNPGYLTRQLETVDSSIDGKNTFLDFPASVVLKRRVGDKVEKVRVTLSLF
jgi:hypothetical protein